MSNPSRRPFADGPDPVLSIRDPFAEFLSESEIEFETPRPGRASDELELFAPQDVAAPASGAGRARSFAWPLVTGAAVTAIMAGSATGLMTRSRALPGGEGPVQPAVSGSVNQLSSAAAVPHGAAAAVPVIEQLPSRTSLRIRDGKRSNTVSPALPRTKATAAAAAISAHPPASGNDVQPLPAVARASLLLAPVPASPTATPSIPSSLAPAHVRVSATASDPDGDELTYRWSAPIGRFANAMERETDYICPDTATTVALTVTVTDGHNGIATDALTIRCVESP